MVDPETGRRSVPVQQPDGTAGHVADVSRSAIEHMAPAEKGWILAAVITMLGSLALITITNYLERTSDTEMTSNFFSIIEQHRGEENRRLQEQNRILAQALSRQADRISRKVQEINQRDFVGPPEP